MRNYPRKTNRFIIFLTGLLLLALATLLLCLHYLPQLRQIWKQSFKALTKVDILWQPFSSFSKTGPIMLILMLLALIICMVCLKVIIAQGGGKRSRVMKVTHDGEQALSIAQVSFIEDLLKQKLANPQLVHSVSASAWKIRKNTALRVDVVIKHGSDPAQIRPILEEAIADMDSLFGTAVPVLIHLSRPWLERKAARTN